MAEVFKTTSYDIDRLMNDIEIGDLALPDLQRPFVWYRKISKIRDLFDSIYKGYPIGYLLLWENANREDYKNIGFDEKMRKIPRFLIIDGQQRLTALYAVIKDQEIFTPDFEKKKIKIAFKPLDSTFRVADAATDKDPEYIPNISAVWSSEGDFFVINKFLASLKAKRELSQAEEKIISGNIQKLINITKYPLTALEIAPEITDEVVSDIFVRINSQGTSLTQADFILTLLSVFWEEGRKEMEQFCIDSRKSPDSSTQYSSFNHIIKPDPDDILRVLVALTFKRAKMADVYSVLRGKNFETNEFSEDIRMTQFEKIKIDLPKVIDNTNWQSFLKILIGTGYKDEDLISSKNAVLFSYVIYLIAKEQFGIETHELQKIIAKWFWMSSLSGRYSSSPETIFEADLNRIKDLSTGTFISGLEKVISDNLSPDFWNITLVNSLETSSARSPYQSAFFASLNFLGTNVLFSKKLVSDLYDPTIKVKKKRLEKHHLFPKNYLIQRYEFDANKDKTKINQVANFTFLEFEKNIDISDASPKDYLDIEKKLFTPEELGEMLKRHAIPANFDEMGYDDFLAQRRKLMAGVIKQGFSKI